MSVLTLVTPSVTRLCARPRCNLPRRWWGHYCSDDCDQHDRARLQREQRPRPALVTRGCAFDPLHTYAVRADQLDGGYCRPDCAAAAARLAMRRAIREWPRRGS